MAKGRVHSRLVRTSALVGALALLLAAWVRAETRGLVVSYVREFRVTGSGGAGGPIALAVRSGLVHVAEHGDQVEVFTTDGRFVHRWGSRWTCPGGCRPGDGDGRFFLPSGIAVDSAGHVFVSDLGLGSNARVQKFSSFGALLAVWEGLGFDRFSYPRDVAVDAAGNVYVSDWGKKRVLMLTGGGALIKEWNGPEFLTWGLAVDDARGRLYVARQDTGRGLGAGIDVFSIAGGGLLARWPQLPLPSDGKMAVDREGRIYGTFTRSVRVFAPSGEPLAEWGSYGEGPSQFREPTGIAVDENGLVYVADYVTGRIQVFLAEFD